MGFPSLFALTAPTHTKRYKSNGDSKLLCPARVESSPLSNTSQSTHTTKTPLPLSYFLLFAPFFAPHFFTLPSIALAKSHTKIASSNPFS